MCSNINLLQYIANYCINYKIGQPMTSWWIPHNHSHMCCNIKHFNWSTINFPATGGSTPPLLIWTELRESALETPPPLRSPPGNVAPRPGEAADLDFRGRTAGRICPLLPVLWSRQIHPHNRLPRGPCVTVLVCEMCGNMEDAYDFLNRCQFYAYIHCPP